MEQKKKKKPASLRLLDQKKEPEAQATAYSAYRLKKIRDANGVMIERAEGINRVLDQVGVSLHFDELQDMPAFRATLSHEARVKMLRILSEILSEAEILKTEIEKNG